LTSPFSNQNDNNLPSAKSKSVQDYQANLQLLQDCWNGLEGKEKQYIPRETKEPVQAWQQRIKRTAFINKFEPSVKDYAGLLSVFTLNEDVAESIKAHLDDVDLMGNDIYTFFHEADQLCLRDGWCAILVDFPKLDPEIQTQEDLNNSDHRPYLVLIERQDINNYRFEYLGGKPALNQVTIQENRIEPDGAFGEKFVTCYRVLRPSEFTIYREIENKGQKTSLITDEGATTLDRIPLVYYSVTESKPFAAKAPFLNLVKLNIEHHQKRSQLNEVIRKCNLPVPVRKGLIRNPSDSLNLPPLTIGPNSIVDIPAEGDFYFAEPTGVAIGDSRKDIEYLEAAMDRMTLDFLTSGQHQKTATEVLLDSAKTSANLKGVARRKESAIQQVFDLWIQYTGEETGGSIVMDESILQMPISPEQIDKLESLASQGLISQKMLLLLLQRGKILPRDVDIDEELAVAGNINQETDEVLAE
jgi:hypothetical protein